MSNASNMKRPLCFLMLLVPVLALGCARTPERASVSGQVLVGGKPLESGSINFIPSDGSGPTAGATVENGVYEITVERGVVVGKNRVEIRGNRKSGRKRRNPFNLEEQIDELVEAVPREFNDQSSLHRDIAPGHNELNFEVPSTADTRNHGIPGRHGKKTEN